MESNNNNYYSEPGDKGFVTYNEPKINPEEPKKKKRGFKRSLSLIAVGLICAVIGGAASGAAILYALPNTSFFKDSALYKSITEKAAAASASSVYDGHPTQLSTKKGALTVAEIAKKVGPAVVAVTTTEITEDLFGMQRPAEGVGTGMIINEEGYVLTNYHVVQGAQNNKVKITLGNNKQVNGKVVNYDANYDVAVVKITDKVDIPATVELGDSDNLQVGESVVAIGNPLGTDFFGSVTTGVVSALNRKIQVDTNSASYIQTDAAINSGNSGGPLINSNGQVIGINTAKIKDGGVEGLGFAIPINAVKNKIPDLSKPILMIGIQGTDVDKTLAMQYNLQVSSGLYVNVVSPFSPAEKAGIRSGDIIVEFDGRKVTTFSQVNTLKSKHKDGDSVSLVVNRDGKEVSLTLRLAAQ